MTEKEWLECDDPTPMLDFLQGGANDRKLRLFACGCCRRNWHLLTDERSRTTVEVEERKADGLMSESALAKLVFDPDAPHDSPRFISFPDAWIAARDSSNDAAWDAARRETDPLNAGDIQREAQANLLRDIFGNPFHPVTVDAAWLNSTVVSLAQAIYEDRAFDRLPILADALEDAGCTNADILNHCRQPGEHVRGCWVVDLLLGKQ